MGIGIVRTVIRIKKKAVKIMNVSAHEDREQQHKHRADILEVEFSRLNGDPAYSTKQVREMLKEKYRHAQVQK